MAPSPVRSSAGTTLRTSASHEEGCERDWAITTKEFRGDGKGQDFSPLAAPVARFARAVVLIGRDAPLIRAALADTGVALFDASTLPQAVNLAAQRAHAGDAVLLSPACASFDMFRDYEHRAQVFCEAVRSLADDAGVSLEGMA